VKYFAATTRGLESSLAASRPPGQPDGFVPGDLTNDERVR
jgi:hypothetical protein